MTYIDIDTPTASSSYSDIYDLMRALRTENPTLRPRQIIAKFVDVALDDPEMNKVAMELVARFVFNSVSSRRNAYVDREERQKRMRMRVAASVLEMAMPNGKTLGRCTFGEAARFGAGLTRLAEMGRPDQVIEDTITEAQARAAVLG